MCLFTTMYLGVFFLFNAMCCVLSLQNKELLNVTIYYESLCADSKKFITQQLHPNLKSLENYINLELVPFGKGHAHEVNGKWKITCHHGIRECELNRIYACVNSIYIATKTANFVSCVMTKADMNDKELKQCAAATEVNWKYIDNCVEKKIGDKLLIKNAKRTNAVTPKIMYVPTIIFNNVYNENLQFEAEENFLKTVCSLLDKKPTACNGDLEYRDL